MTTRLYPTLLHIFASLTIAFSIAGCGSSNKSDSDSDVVGEPIPEIIKPVAIHYPPAISTTEKESMVVRGSISSNQTLTALSFNGNDITGDIVWSDSNTSWQVTLALVTGGNTLAMSYEDADGNLQENAFTRSIYRQTHLTTPTDMLDYAGQILTLDRAQKSVVAIDKNTGDRSLFAKAADDSDARLIAPTLMTLDEANNRLLVLDQTQNAIIAIDLTTKAFSRWIDGDTNIIGGDETYSLASPLTIAIDDDNNRLLIVDPLAKEGPIADPDDSTINIKNPHTGIDKIFWSVIYAADLTSGELSILVDTSTLALDGVAFPQFNSLLPRGKASYDSTNNALVFFNDTQIAYGLDTSGDGVDDRSISHLFSNLVSIDLATGLRTYEWMSVQDIDAANNRAWDIADGNVITIDLETFASEILLLNNGLVDTDFLIRTPAAVRFDSTNDRLIVVDEDGYTVPSVDPDTNEANDNAGDTYMAFYNVDLTENTVNALHPDVVTTQDLVYSDVISNYLELSTDGLTAQVIGLRDSEDDSVDNNIERFDVNLATGERTLVSVETELPARLRTPSHIQLYADDNRFAVLDISSRFILESARDDITSQTIISGPNLEATIPFAGLSGFYYDEATMALFMSDIEYKAIFSFTPSDAERVVLTTSTPNIETSASSLRSPSDITVDANGNNIYISDNSTNKIIQYDLNTGVRSVLVENNTGDSVFLYSPLGLTINEDNSSLYVVDTNRFDINSQGVLTSNVLPALLDIDIENQDKGFVINQDDTREREITLGSNGDVIHDFRNNRILVSGTHNITNLTGAAERVGSIHMLNLATGEMSFLFSPDGKFENFDKVRDITGIALDYVGNRVLIADREQNAVYEASLSTGNRSVISNDFIPNNETPIISPSGIAVNRSGTLAYISDSGYPSPIVVDLSTGARSLLNTNPSNEIFQPRGMTLDHTNNILYVVDDSLDAIVAIDLATGEQSYF